MADEKLDKEKKKPELIFFVSILNLLLTVGLLLFVGTGFNMQKVDNVLLTSNQNTMNDNIKVLNDNLELVSSDLKVINSNVAISQNNTLNSIEYYCSNDKK